MTSFNFKDESFLKIDIVNGEELKFSHTTRLDLVLSTRRTSQSEERNNSSSYDDVKREKKVETMDEKSQEENPEDSVYDNSDVEDSEEEEEVFRSDDEPDEEINETMARLRERWAAQARGELANQPSPSAPIPRPQFLVPKTVFSFDTHFPFLSIWAGAVPPAQKMDMSSFIREAGLIRDGQPEPITQPPSKLNHVLANQHLDHIRHHRAALYPDNYTRAMVAYAVDPYFYVDVGVPPPADLQIPPLPASFFDPCPRIPDELVNPGPNDPIIPIFYKRCKW